MQSERAPSQLDIAAFAQGQQHRQGHDPLSRYARLLSDVHGPGLDRQVAWSVHGEMRTSACGDNSQPWLHLVADVTVPLVCQRCLEPVDELLQVDRWFRFVADEDTAIAEDDEAEEDLLVLTPEFDLQALIEDELILELPLIAQHETCPTPLAHLRSDTVDPVPAEAPRQKPFAVLAKLKSGRSDTDN